MYAYGELLNDREIILEAMKNDDEALSFASGNLWNDQEIVLEAVKNMCYGLQYGSENLQNDREIVAVTDQELKETQLKSELDEGFTMLYKENQNLESWECQNWLPSSVMACDHP